jgi:hypothetical protein
MRPGGFGGYLRRCGESRCLHLQSQEPTKCYYPLETKRSFETSRNIAPTAKCQITEHLNPHQRRCENVKAPTHLLINVKVLPLQLHHVVTRHGQAVNSKQKRLLEDLSTDGRNNVWMVQYRTQWSAVKMFRDVKPCRWAGSPRPRTRRHIPEDLNLQLHRCENETLVPRNAENFLTSWVTVSFPKTTTLHVTSQTLLYNSLSLSLSLSEQVHVYCDLSHARSANGIQPMIRVQLMFPLWTSLHQRWERNSKTRA